MMMEAEMYGMMPKANTVNLDRAPPENILNRFRYATLLTLEQLFAS